MRKKVVLLKFPKFTKKTDKNPFKLASQIAGQYSLITFLKSHCPMKPKKHTPGYCVSNSWYLNTIGNLVPQSTSHISMVQQPHVVMTTPLSVQMTGDISIIPERSTGWHQFEKSVFLPNKCYLTKKKKEKAIIWHQKLFSFLYSFNWFWWST